jgi:hypothetical protein
MTVKASLARRSSRLLVKREAGTSVVDPDPYVFGPPGSGSVDQRYGSGSFYLQAKKKKKCGFLLFFDIFMTFYLRKMM